MYLTFEEYQIMGGTLDETAFNDFEFEAECQINWYTFNRLENDTEISDKVKKCTYALIKLAKLKADALMLGSQVTKQTDEEGHITTISTSAYIASESNDGVSRSYNMVNASDIFKSLSDNQAGNQIEDTIQKCLQGVVNSLGQKVLYRGLYPNE